MPFAIKTVPKDSAWRVPTKSSASTRLSKSVQRNLSMSADPIACPRCSGGKIVLKHSRERKPFYGCTHFPSCTFSSTYRPVAERCPECSSPYLVERELRGVNWLRCPVRGCKFERRVSLF
ncbi:MAG: hypothetical protein FJW36_15110 [Acidobacteria bacterium]|nr:hypothetical protein [Acidobacteriota bacterium]